MTPPNVCYILAFPFSEPALPDPAGKIAALKDAPYFQPIDLDIRPLGQESLQIAGYPVQVTRQLYEGQVQMVECLFRLDNLLESAAMGLMSQLQATLQSHWLPESALKSGLYEEYVILLFAEELSRPDDFIATHAQALARLLRLQKEILEPREVEEILTSRIYYSTQDLTLVDWDGALLIAPKGDFQSDIELLKIGNYQLLRYRMLDQEMEDSLWLINDTFQTGKRPALFPNPSRRALRQVIEKRLSLLLNFERVDQNLLLIGDWYTAKLYQTIHDELYLDDWKKIVQSKLENLQAIIEIMQANFTITWSSFIDLLQLTGWLILLIGYFILFFLELN